MTIFFFYFYCFLTIISANPFFIWIFLSFDSLLAGVFPYIASQLVSLSHHHGSMVGSRVRSQFSPPRTRKKRERSNSRKLSKTFSRKNSSVAPDKHNVCCMARRVEHIVRVVVCWGNYHNYVTFSIFLRSVFLFLQLLIWVRKTSSFVILIGKLC